MQVINALVKDTTQSTICNFWPQLQILGGQLTPLPPNAAFLSPWFTAQWNTHQSDKISPIARKSCNVAASFLRPFSGTSLHTTLQCRTNVRADVFFLNFVCFTTLVDRTASVDSRSWITSRAWPVDTVPLSDRRRLRSTERTLLHVPRSPAQHVRPLGFCHCWSVSTEQSSGPCPQSELHHSCFLAPDKDISVHTVLAQPAH